LRAFPVRRGQAWPLRTPKRYIRITSGAYRAMFDSGFCTAAQARDFIKRVDVLMDNGQIIKSDDTACVSAVAWNNKDVVVKRYNHKGFIHSLRHTIKGSRAIRGWVNGHRLEMFSIPTPKPLAYIERRRSGLVWKSYLVTEYIKGQKLYDFQRDSNITEENRSRVTKQFVEMLNRLDRYRITHGDLKHTNILITDNGPVLTDLDAVRIHKLKWTYRLRRAKDINRFLRKLSICPQPDNYYEILTEQDNYLARKIAGDFEKIDVSNWAIYARRDLPKHIITQLALAVDNPNHSENQLMKVPSSDYTRVFRCNVSFNGTERAFYLKQYLFHSLWDFVKYLLRSSRARRAFEASLMLQSRGFDVPAVVGLFERRFGPFHTDNALLVRAVEHSKSLWQCRRQIKGSNTEEALREKRQLIASFGETVGRMHAEGIFHGDLRLGNVLVQRKEGKWQFFFIDNERTKKFFRLLARLRLKNLVQINMYRQGITNTDRMRFFKAYLQENPCVWSRRSRWVERIIEKTNLRLRRKKWFTN